MTAHLIILVSSSAGLIVTTIFVRSLHAERACGERGACTIVAETVQGNFLKVRNTSLGFIFYIGVIMVEMAYMYFGSVPVLVLIYEQTAIWIAAGMSFYLLYQLLFVLKMRCPLCVTAHILNWIMAVSIVHWK